MVTAAVDELLQLADNQLPERAVIFDAGCGDGTAFPLLVEKFSPSKIIGMEMEGELVIEAQTIANNLACDITVMCGDVCHSQIADHSVDILFCHQTLHHLPNQELALQEFRRILKPDGFLMLAESCQAFTESLKVELLFRHPTGNQHSADEYLQMLRTAGFDIKTEQVSSPNPWWAKPMMGILEKLNSAKCPHTPKQLCVVTKPQPTE